MREVLRRLPELGDGRLFAKFVADFRPFRELVICPVRLLPFSHEGPRKSTHSEEKEEVLRGRKLVPIVHDGVIREGVEFVIRSPDIVEEDPAILVLQDRLELLLGRRLLDGLNGKVPPARDVILVLPPLAGSICITSPTPAPAPTPSPVRPFGGTGPPTAPAPTPALATLGTATPMELLQSVFRNAGVKHDLVPHVLRPLGGL